MANLEIGDYSEKSFYVAGENTSKYTSLLKENGGRYNRYLKSDGITFPGWIFSKNRYPTIKELIDDINQGKVEPSVSQKDTPKMGTRAVPKKVPIKSTKEKTVTPTTPDSNLKFNILKPEFTYQTITYKVIKPEVGFKAILNFEDRAIETQVVQTDSNPDEIIEDVYVSSSNSLDDVYKLGIVNGKWKIIGILDDHSVTFV